MSLQTGRREYVKADRAGVLKVLPEKLILQLDSVRRGTIVRDLNDRTLLTTLGESVIHLRFEKIAELLIIEVRSGNQRNYGILALDLTDPVEEDMTILTGVEDPCP